MCTDKQLNELRNKAMNSTKQLFSNQQLLKVVDQYIDEMVKDEGKRIMIFNSRRSMKNTWAKLIKERMIERGIKLGGNYGTGCLQIQTEK